MIANILSVIVMVAAIVIVIRAEPALNRMNACTPFMVRSAFHLLTLGSTAEIVSILLGEAPSWPTAIVFLGVASLLVCERRLRVLCPSLKRNSP